MPHNIGQMFYYGDVPWHGLGNLIDKPADLETALREGGLDWTVGKVPLMTNETIPTFTDKRVAIVRDDLAPGDDRRVLGIVHKGFEPLQNRVGLEIFDKLLGQAAKYHTGGYLGNGERIWLLARIPTEMKVSEGDCVEPYILFSNSHDGTLAVDVRLTTVRVVCQNTLGLALRNGDLDKVFKRKHDGMWTIMERDLEGFLGMWLKDVRKYETEFKFLSDVACSEAAFEELSKHMFPMPTRPSQGATGRASRAYETRVRTTEGQRGRLREVWDQGVSSANGALFPTVPREEHTLWGALNTATATVDHILSGKSDADPYYYSIFGKGDLLKRRAWNWVTAQGGKR